MFNKEDKTNPFEQEITVAGIEKFLSVHGQRGAKTLSLAGKQRGFIEALSSDVGQEILKDVMVKMEILLENIIQEKSTNKERAEYRNLRDIFNRWAKKIMLFEEAKKKIQEG